MKVILAVQPDGRQIGYAVFRGATLVDHGAKSLGFNRPLAQRLHRISVPFFRSLVERHNPDMIVLPPPNKMAGTGRNRFLRALTIELARQPNVVTSFSRRDIQATFGTLLNMERPSKDVTMQALVKWFPKLLPYLPKPRRAWDSEDYWVPMFDAVSLAVTYLHHDE